MCSLQQHNNAAPGENEKMEDKAKKQTSVWMSVFSCKMRQRFY
jgi:hypothetical protein